MPSTSPEVGKALALIYASEQAFALALANPPGIYQFKNAARTSLNV